MFSIFNGRSRTLGGEKSEVFLQASVDFRDYLHLFKGAKLSVFMAIALHINEGGWAYPSYKKLHQETGYNETTIKKALGELCDLEIEGHRVLLRYQPTGKDGTFESNQYLLFPSAEEVEKYEEAGVHHLGNLTRGGFDDRGAKSTPRSPWCKKPTTENCTTKKNQLEQEPLLVDDQVDQDALDALLEIGIQPHSRAVELASTHAPDQVIGWCEYAKVAGGLENPAALVVRRLEDGEPAPPRIELEPCHSRPPPGQTVDDESLPDIIVPGTDLDARDVWCQVLAELRMQMTGCTFDTWLRGSRVIRVDDQKVVVRVRDGFAVEWLKVRWIVPIQRTLAGIVGQGLDVEFSFAKE